MKKKILCAIAVTFFILRVTVLTVNLFLVIFLVGGRERAERVEFLELPNGQARKNNLVFEGPLLISEDQYSSDDDAEEPYEITEYKYDEYNRIIEKKVLHDSKQGYVFLDRIVTNEYNSNGSYVSTEMNRDLLKKVKYYNTCGDMTFSYRSDCKEYELVRFWGGNCYRIYWIGGELYISKSDYKNAYDKGIMIDLDYSPFYSPLLKKFYTSYEYDENNNIVREIFHVTSHYEAFYVDIECEYDENCKLTYYQNDLLDGSGEFVDHMVRIEYTYDDDDLLQESCYYTFDKEMNPQLLNRTRYNYKN